MSDDSPSRRFLGDAPGRVALRLIVLSIVVGIVMATFGIDPLDVVFWLRDSFHELWEMGFTAVERAGRYLLLGAVVVIPIWLVLRLLKFASGRG